jgi:hypothetical protein
MTHLYIHKYSGVKEDPYQVKSRKYVGWYSNHATREDAEVALKVLAVGESSDG